MSCTEFAPLLELTPLFTGDLPPSDLLEADAIEALEDHLARCDACRSRADELKGAYGQWAGASEESMQPLSPDLRERVLADRRDPAKKKKPAANEPTADPAAVEAVRAKVVLSCSFCHDGMHRADSVFCAACLAPHHKDCFDDHGHCSMPGCQETHCVRPQETEARPPRRRRGGLLAVLFLAGGVGGGIAAWSAKPEISSPGSIDVTTDVSTDVSGPLGDASLPAIDTGPTGADQSEQPQEQDQKVESIRIVNEDPANDSAKDPDAKTPKIDVAGGADFLTIDIDAPASLHDVMAAISKTSGINVLVDPAVSETVFVSLRMIPFREAIEVIARMTRCEIEVLPGEVLFLSQPPKVTVQFTDANVRTILRLIAAYSGKNVIVGPAVKGSTGVDFKEVHWKQAIKTIAGNIGAHVTWLGDDVLVTAKALPADVVPQAPTQTVTFPPVLPPPPRELTGIAKMWKVTEEQALARIKREAEENRTQPIDLELVNADLSDVCDEIGLRVRRNILVDPNVEETLTVSLNKIAWPHAINVLTRLTRCEVEVRPGGILLLVQPPKVELAASLASAPELYRLLAAYAGKNLALNANVRGRVTTELRGIHWVEALNYLATVYGHKIKKPNEDMLSITAYSWALPLLPEPSATKKLSAFEKRREELLEEIARMARLERHDDLRAKQVELQRLLEAETDASERPRDPKAVAEAEQRIDAKMNQIEELASAGKTEELIKVFGELRQYIQAFSQLETDEAQREKALEAWYKRLDSWGEVQLSVRLQFAINAGNTHLRAMAEAIRSERYRGALASFRRLEKVAADMQKQEREVFHRNAEALLVRGQALRDRAQMLQEIGALPLELTALVFMGKSVDERSSALINDRVVREGETPLDAEGNALEGVVLQTIERRTVRFRYKKAEFVRELRD